MGFRHVVAITFRDDASDEQVQAALDGLAGLPAAIPELRAYSFGLDAGMAEGNASLAIVADFDDAAGYEVYRDHPAHQTVIHEAFLPIIAGRSAVQFRT